ncbi:hypothetical protein V8C35DRAFT_193740 [Trichoderma chlorosporum]
MRVQKMLLDSTRTGTTNIPSSTSASHAHPKLTRDTGQAVAAHRVSMLLSAGLSNTPTRASTALLKDAEQRRWDGWPRRIRLSVGNVGTRTNYPDTYSIRHLLGSCMGSEPSIRERHNTTDTRTRDPDSQSAFARFITAKGTPYSQRLSEMGVIATLGSYSSRAGHSARRIQRAFASWVPPTAKYGRRAARTLWARHCPQSVIFLSSRERNKKTGRVCRQKLKKDSLRSDSPDHPDYPIAG